MNLTDPVYQNADLARARLEALTNAEARHPGITGAGVTSAQ